jgi:tRNA modification GTPase
MSREGETSAAIQTAPGKGGIAVIAVSGPGVGRLLASVFRPIRSHSGTGSGIIRLGHLVDDGRIIDEAVVHEREDFAEINIHGGPAAARATLELLSRRGIRVISRTSADTFRTAHPRHNNPAVGKEMLEALPSARSTLVAATVTQQWSAGMSELARNALASARFEPQVARRLRDAALGLPTAAKLLNPPEVVIAGAPNVGKSALANALVGRQVSIVDETAGTTRDWVRELTLISGVPVWLTDTAGLWDAPGSVDAEAVCRARQRAEGADLVVLLQAGGEIHAPSWLHADKVLKVSAKCDVCPAAPGAEATVSAATGKGLDELREKILSRLGLNDIDPTRPMAFTRRQAELLEAAAGALEAGQTDLARDKLTRLLAG